MPDPGPSVRLRKRARLVPERDRGSSRFLALLLIGGLAACATQKNQDDLTYEKLVAPYPQMRETRYCYVVGHKPAHVLSYGECLTKHGKLVSPVAAAWLDKNYRWFQMPGWTLLTAQAETIGRDLEAQGYDPNSEAYTAELSSRLAAYKRAHPAAVPKTKKKKKIAAG